MGKLVYGVGVNDADYNVCNKKQREDGSLYTEICPFYVYWTNMLSRCNGKAFQERQQNYLGCSATPEWYYFMTFRAWMIQQDWKDKHLDKDILFPGNKFYAPDKCVFVDQKVNKFINENKKSNSGLPVGVNYEASTGKYRAQCCDVITGKQKNLGRFETAKEGHEAWLTFKLEQAKILAAEQDDERVAKALIERYTNYK